MLRGKAKGSSERTQREKPFRTQPGSWGEFPLTPARQTNRIVADQAAGSALLRLRRRSSQGSIQVMKAKNAKNAMTTP